MAGLLPGRPGDVLKFGVSYTKIGRDAVAADLNPLATTPSYPILDQELVSEVSYATQIAPRWTVQPDLQVTVHPGGNVPDPNDVTKTVGNAVIAGVRSTINF